MTSILMKRIGSGCLVFSLVVLAIASVMPSASAALQTNWTTEVPLSEDRAQAVVVADSENGHLYVIGGAIGVDVGIGYKKTVDTVLVYDLNSDVSWRAAPMPVGVRAASGGLGEDGRIYVFGGYNDTLGTQSLTQIYDIATDSWTFGVAMPAARAFTSCAVNWPNFYIVGGYVTGQVLQYNAEDDSWRTGPSLPVNRWSGQAVYVPEEHAVYYIGGTDNWATARGDVYKWVTWLASWTTVASLPQASSGHGAALGMDGMIYVAGGSSEAYNVLGTVYDDTFYYNPDNDTWVKISYLNEPKKYLGLVSMQDGLILAVGGNNKTATLATVESLRPIEATTTISSTSVNQGGSFIVSLNLEAAYATVEDCAMSYYMVSETGITYPVYFYEYAGDNPAAIITIPEIMPTGTYKLYVYWWVEFMNGADWDVPEVECTIKVLAGTPISQQLTNLQNQIDDLQGQIDDLNARLSELNRSISDLTDRIDALESELGQVSDDAQQSSSYASSANTMALMAMILSLIAVILIALNLVMSMRKKS